MNGTYPFKQYFYFTRNLSQLYVVGSESIGIRPFCRERFDKLPKRRNGNNRSAVFLAQRSVAKTSVGVTPMFFPRNQIKGRMKVSSTDTLSILKTLFREDGMKTFASPRSNKIECCKVSGKRKGDQAQIGHKEQQNGHKYYQLIGPT